MFSEVLNRTEFGWRAFLNPLESLIANLLESGYLKNELETRKIRTMIIWNGISWYWINSVVVLVAANHRFHHLYMFINVNTLASCGYHGGQSEGYYGNGFVTGSPKSLANDTPPVISVPSIFCIISRMWKNLPVSRLYVLVQQSPTLCVVLISPCL